MAFNPIHLAESDFLTVDPSLRDASFAPPAAGANATTGANNLSMERFCKTSYFFDLPWEIPFPRQPTAPLLYFPEAYKNLSTSPAEVGVMDCEVDAMADGVLSRIPLAYYPLQQRSVQAAYNAAAATEQRIADMQRQATASGQLERLTWKAVDVNPAIDPADAELLDTDIDASMVQQRDAPSLTLMQRPLYTDMGLVPQEQRHAARLARIVPSHLRSLSQAAAADLPGSPASPINGAGGASPFDLAGSQDQSDAAEWPTQVSRSFKHAKGLDRQFDDFIEELVRTKLGLNKASADHCDIARAMWRALFEGSSVEQQTTVWSAICIFSMNYNEMAETNEAAAKELQRMISGARLPNYMTTWRPLIRRYVESLAAHVATLRGGVAERQAALELAIELDATSFSVPPFHAYFDGKRMLRRQGTELGKDNLPLRLYPLEVLPIFPSGFREAAESTGISLQASQQGTLDFLAERTCELRHVVLPGAPTHVSPTGPHVLVSGTNLLVAETEEDSTAGHRKSNASEEGCAPVLAEGATVAYHSAKEGTYESLYQDDENTASYLMRVCRDQSAQGRGSTNPDGLCVVFDRIGTKNVFVKAPQSSREMPTTKYVLLYSDAEPTVEVHEEGELAHGVKRERSLENTEEPSVRVKRETE